MRTFHRDFPADSVFFPPPAQAHEDSWEGSEQHHKHNSPVAAEAQAIIFETKV